MELKGELKRGGLPSLFRNFATENFTGVLTITSPVGEKLITLTENEVTIYCDELNESSRLGNILLARDKITMDSLEATLRDQKKIEPRPMLGDMLIRRGQVTQQDCIDARRFQIEEDIADILSWKNARFHFASRESAREIRPDDFAPEQVHRLTIDPESFFKSVAKATEDWEAINDRLPTQYLCFKVSSKADEVKDRLPKPTQKVLRSLSEGRTIEGAVKQCCLGRIETCVQVIELLEKGLIIPASGADLRFQASEHRAQKRYHDALYIYRRLLESPESNDERLYLENLVNEIASQIQNVKLAGGYSEEAVILSHRGAKDKFQRNRLIRNVLAGVAVLALIVVASVFWIRSNRMDDELPKRWNAAMAEAETAVQGHDFQKATRVFQDFYNSLPDKDSDVARSALDQMMRLPGLIDRWIRTQLPDLEVGLSGSIEETKKSLVGLRQLKDEYPNSKSAKKIEGLIERGEQRLKESETATKTPDTQVIPFSRNLLVDKLKEAIQHQQEKRYGAAERGFREITNQAPANDDVWKQADAGLNSVLQVMSRAKEELEKARDELTANHGEKCLELLKKFKLDYPDLEITAAATTLEMREIGRKKSAQELYRTAIEEETAGKVYQAIMRLRMLAENFPEFEIAEEARNRADKNKKLDDAVRKKLEQALEYMAAQDFRNSRLLFKELLDKNYQLLVDQKVDVPVFFNSTPPGSTLSLNGEKQGNTPATVLIRAGAPFKILIERPGFKPLTIAKDNISSDFLENSFQMSLDPIIVDLKVPLFAPAISYYDKPLILAGTTLYGLGLPSQEPAWSLQNLFNEKDNSIEGLIPTPADEAKWPMFCRQSPTPYLPGKLMLPLRNRDLLELDLTNPAAAKSSILVRKMPSEISGKIYFNEHSRLALKALMVAPFSDGFIRSYNDIDRPKGNAPKENWNLPMDPTDRASRENMVAGLYAHKSLAYLLTSSGRLAAFDPVDGRETWSTKFGVMSSRSTFGDRPGDDLAAFVQRDGKVLIYNLATHETVWELPKRQAMQESVGALVAESGVFIATANNESGTLQLFSRTAGTEGKPKELWTASLEGHVDIDLSLGKHIYMVTHLNRVTALDTKTGRQRWVYRMDPSLGKPLWIRAIGDFVYVGTMSGKLLVLKAD